jgi:hypothetical protein
MGGKHFTESHRVLQIFGLLLKDVFFDRFKLLGELLLQLLQLI